MSPHKLTISLASLLFLFFSSTTIAQIQKRKAPPGGRLGVVVDERLAALRATPQLNGKLVRRLGRGRLVAIRAVKRGEVGVVFLLVNVTSRTHGWIQREAVASPSNAADEQNLFQFIQKSTEFDRIARARLFLDYFPRSRHRAEVLLLLGDAAEVVSAKLSRDAARRVDSQNSVSEQSYFLNHSGLDRYNRLGVLFVFDERSKRLHYDGAAWREVVRRYRSTPQAVEAQLRLESRSGDPNAR
jgi:hypothetical protein